MVNKAKAAERNIKGSLDELILTITNVQMTFKNSMASIVNDEDTSTPVLEESVAEPEIEPAPLKVTGRKPVPKKKATQNT
jgi:hypothetical protein